MEAATAKVQQPPLSRFRGVPQWRVTVVDATKVERQFQAMAGLSLRVGTNPANDIVITDETVSRVHAELTAETHGVRVRDLGSTNGCQFGGAQLVEAVLSAGTVTLGSHTRLIISSAEAALESLEPVAQFGPLIGRSPTMRALFKSLGRVAESNTTVLIQAESGTGKELAARAIHEASARSSKPYVVFDCGAVAPTLIESALFGHEKGAFSGATHRRVGCFEEAHGGTLFIDEVGDLPLELQPRLLRAIESREIRRVGSSKPLAVDVRVIAATHRDLARDVNSGQFREDLYYRLAVVRLRIPPLRERVEDLKLLVEHLMRQATSQDHVRVEAMMNALSEQHWASLRAHPWRGNVRELRNAAERSVATGAPLNPTTELTQSTASAPTDAGETFALEQPFLEQKQQLLERFEKAYLQAMLAKHDGNFTRAAAQAGIDRMYFKRLLSKWGLSRDGGPDER